MLISCIKLDHECVPLEQIRSLLLLPEWEEELTVVFLRLNEPIAVLQSGHKTLHIAHKIKTMI